MSWFKIDDGFYSHPKVVSIPRSIRVVAIGTWTLAGVWSADHLTDGYVPLEQVDELGGTLEGAAALVKAKLWTKTRTGFRFQSWSDYQPTKVQVEEARESERTRKAEYRAKAKRHHQESRPRPVSVPAGQTGLSHGTEAGVRTPRPDPTRPDPLPSEGGARGALPPVENSEPPTRCPDHLTTLTPPKCGACKDARLEAEAWALQRAAAAHPAVRRPAWDPATHCEHGQLHGKCEACEQEARDAAKVIHGRFGGVA